MEEPTKEWEKSDELTAVSAVMPSFTRNVLIPFISQAIQQAVKAREAELIEKVKKLIIYDIDDTHRTPVNMHGYNDAIDEVIALIKG
jgi:hypothetical protein